MVWMDARASQIEMLDLRAARALGAHGSNQRGASDRLTLRPAFPSRRSITLPLMSLSQAPPAALGGVAIRLAAGQLLNPVFAGGRQASHSAERSLEKHGTEAWPWKSRRLGPLGARRWGGRGGGNPLSTRPPICLLRVFFFN